MKPFPHGPETGLRIPQDLTLVGFGGVPNEIDMTGNQFEGGSLGKTAGQQMGALLQQKPARPMLSKIVLLKGR